MIRAFSLLTVLLVSTFAKGQNDSEKEFVRSDTTYTILFDWETENEKREESRRTYQGANICSRWIKFPDKKFQDLKRFDGNKVKITVQRYVVEGLKSKEERGIDTFGMQGTYHNMGCACILAVEPENESQQSAQPPISK